MNVALKRFRANLRALGTSLWFQLALLAAYFYILYTAIGFNDAHIGILAGICTGTLLPGIADTIGEKIKKRKGQVVELVVTDVMLGAAVSNLDDLCVSTERKLDVRCDGAFASLTGISREELRAAIAAALRAREGQS